MVRFAVWGTQAVVTNHVPMTGEDAVDIAVLNDNNEATCLDLPAGNATPWQIKLQMDSVPVNELVKIVSDGMPCNHNKLYVMLNKTEATTSRTCKSFSW